MANRLFEQYKYGLEKVRVELYADVTIGASGAPTLVTANSKGIKSITRTGAGTYDIVFSDTYKRLLAVGYTIVNTSAPAAPALYVKTNSVSNATTPKVTVVTNSAGTATDPASGEEYLFRFELKNSTV